MPRAQRTTPKYTATRTHVQTPTQPLPCLPPSHTTQGPHGRTRMAPPTCPLPLPLPPPHCTHPPPPLFPTPLHTTYTLFPHHNEHTSVSTTFRSSPLHHTLLPPPLFPLPLPHLPPPPHPLNHSQGTGRDTPTIYNTPRRTLLPTHPHPPLPSPFPSHPHISTHSHAPPPTKSPPPHTPHKCRHQRREHPGNSTYFRTRRQRKAKCISKYVVNLYNKTLSHATLSPLSKGLGFVPTPSTPSLSKLSEDITAFARALRIKYCFRDSPYHYSRHRYKPKSNWDCGRSTNQTLENYIEAISTETPSLCTHVRRNLSKPEQAALKRLSKRTDIVIKPADKGSCIVVQDTATYIREGLEHLSDRNTYTRLPGDPTPSLIESINSPIDSIHELGHIDTYTQAYLTPPQDTRTQHMYFLKKLHKNPYGIRPIVSGSSCTTEHISAYIDSIIKPLVPLIPSYIKDSSHVIALLEKTCIPKEALLVTIDASSVYTNIPHDEGTSAFLEAVAASQTYDLPPDILQKLFDVVLKCNIFRFENSIYAKMQGTAMGTNMAPSYANLFMDRFKRSFLADELIQPLLLKHYIDDILCILPGTREELDSFLERLNRAHHKLRFTWSISESHVEFLNLNIFKGPRFNNTNHLDLSTHFKKTNTFQYLHYSSSHPRSIFRGLVKGEAIRFLRSNTTTFTATKKSLSSHLLSRGYPKAFRDPILDSVTYDLRHKYIPSLPSPTPNPSLAPSPSSSLAPSPSLAHGPSPSPSPSPRLAPNPTSNPSPSLTHQPPRLVATYSPYLPCLRDFLTKHWHIITQDPQLFSLFQLSPHRYATGEIYPQETGS